VVRGAHAAGAIHVLHHHDWIARYVAADMPADDARVEVVAAAGAEADDKVDGAAAIEIGDALGWSGFGPRQECRRQQSECECACQCVLLRRGVATAVPQARKPQTGTPENGGWDRGASQNHRWGQWGALKPRSPLGSKHKKSARRTNIAFP